MAVKTKERLTYENISKGINIPIEWTVIDNTGIVESGSNSNKRQMLLLQHETGNYKIEVNSELNCGQSHAILSKWTQVGFQVIVDKGTKRDYSIDIAYGTWPDKSFARIIKDFMRMAEEMFL